IWKAHGAALRIRRALAVSGPSAYTSTLNLFFHFRTALTLGVWRFASVGALYLDSCSSFLVLGCVLAFACNNYFP
ncbi:hypothetical protein, partial [Holospora undulata]|uniref:hypothetical protein n=1 Tax=Holospora undulata TaxID=1169117 RepID=UPI001F30EEE6